MPFCHGLAKYWPDCPYPLYFITNQKTPPCGQTIAVGADRGWSGNLLIALRQIETPLVLYAQEDYWITRAVDQSMIADYVSLLEQGRADYIRLYPAPGPDYPFPLDNRLGIWAQHAPYRTSNQMSLWRRSVLQDLLRADETGWNFEVWGSLRSRKYAERFLCVSKRKYGISYVFTAIVDGEWIPAARQYAASEGIDVDFDSLPTKPWLVRRWRQLKRSSYRTWRKATRAVSKLR